MGLTNFDFAIIQTEAELKFTSGTESFIENWEKCGHLLGTGGQDINIPNQEIFPDAKQNRTQVTGHVSHISLSACPSAGLARNFWFVKKGSGTLHMKNTKLMNKGGFQSDSEASRCGMSTYTLTRCYSRLPISKRFPKFTTYHLE